MIVLKHSQEWLDLVKDIDTAMAGDAFYVPNPLERVGKLYNIVQGRFTLIGGVSGSGKSAYLDSTVVLQPWYDYIRLRDEIQYEALYFSMERTKKVKFAKWLAWFIYKSKGWILSGEDLRGTSGNTFKTSVLQTIRKTVEDNSETFNSLLDSVDVYDGRIDAHLLADKIHAKARRLGVLFKSDSIGVTVDDSPEYVTLFKDDQIRQLRNGSTERYVTLNHNGEEFILTPDKHRYILHNPKTIVQIALDGMGIIDASEFGGNVKKAVDNATNILADARDIYGFCPVAVSQFNRGISDTQRAKLHGSQLAPSESDFKDSGNIYQASDLAIGIFDPYKMKAYDKMGLYGGIDILNGMMSPEGHNRGRTMHVLKNSYGMDSMVYGLKFLGECGYYEVLPKTDTLELQEVYAKIAAGY